MIDFSPEALKARWDELTAAREAIDAELDPKRTELDSIADGTANLTLADAKAREAALRGMIKNLQADLFPIEQERANIARALNGKTG